MAARRFQLLLDPVRTLTFHYLPSPSLLDFTPFPQRASNASQRSHPQWLLPAVVVDTQD